MKRRRKRNKLVRNTLRIIFLLGVMALGSMLVERTTVAPAQASDDPVQDISGRNLLPIPKAHQKPNLDTKNWELALVNPWNPLPADFAPQTVEIERGYRFDARAADMLTAMLDGCRAAGLHPLICSAYRTPEYQIGLFHKQVKKQERMGLTGDEAVQAAGEVVAVPGTSEHELGLAADIVSMEYQLLDQGQEQTAEFQWLREHCAEYGFILRYPPEKSEITGIIYEPWHFRYVGEQAAAYIMEHGLTLEEFLTE